MIMATNNNFKELEKEDQEMTPHAPRKVERQLMGLVNSGQFAGNVIELYFTRFIKMFLMLLGVQAEEPKDIASEDSQESGEVR